MTFKLILLLCLASVPVGKHNLVCYLKSNSTKTSSNMLHTYTTNAGYTLTYPCWSWPCSSCNFSARTMCPISFPKLTRDFISKKNICQKVAGKLGIGQAVKVPIYLTGACTSSKPNAPWAWMEPRKMADVCLSTMSVVAKREWTSLAIVSDK